MQLGLGGSEPGENSYLLSWDLQGGMMTASFATEHCQASLSPRAVAVKNATAENKTWKKKIK